MKLYYFSFLAIHKPDIWQEKWREHVLLLWNVSMINFSLWLLVLPTRCVFSRDIITFYTVLLECMCWKSKFALQQADGEGDITLACMRQQNHNQLVPDKTLFTTHFLVLAIGSQYFIQNAHMVSIKMYHGTMKWGPFICWVS